MGGRSLADVLEAGDGDWRRLRAGLSAIEAMLDGGAPAETLLGLPFERALGQATAQAERIAAEAKASVDRAAREGAIRAEAGRALGLDGDLWLAGDWERGEGCRLDAAEASNEGLALVRSALRARTLEVEKEGRKADVIAGLQSRLRQAAASAFDEAHAAFFLGNRRAELGWETPLAHCRDERSLEACKRLLPRKTARR